MSDIVVKVGKVKCRACGEEVEIELPSGPAISFARLMVQVEERASKAHACKADQVAKQLVEHVDQVVVDVVKGEP